jgi:hypothetical protein
VILCYLIFGPLSLILVNHETQERQVQIEDLWMNLKTHSNKKLKTFQSHLDRLKEISSPSVKECLQIYNQSRLNNSSVGQVKQNHL